MIRMESDPQQDPDLRYCLCERLLWCVRGLRGPAGGPSEGGRVCTGDLFQSLNATSTFLPQGLHNYGPWSEAIGLLCQLFPLGPRSDVPSSQKPTWASSLPDTMSRLGLGTGAQGLGGDQLGFSAEPRMCPRGVAATTCCVCEQLRLSEMSFLLPGCVEGPGLPRTHTVSSPPSPSSPIPPCTLPSMDLSLLPSVHSFIHPSMQLSAHLTTHLTTHLSPNSPSVQPPSHPFSPAPTYSPTHQPADLSAHLPIYISICPFADPLFSLSSDQSTHSFIY